MRISFNIAGLRETRDAMAGLSKATARRQMRDALMAGGELTARVARALAPVDEGGLRESIDVSTRLSARQAVLHRKMAEVEVFVGPRSSPKSIVQEFGSVEQPPQSYMRPAWAQTGRQVLARIADEIMVRVNAAVARAKKKAAR